MKRNDKWDACHGLKMKYANPLTGDYAMPTIAAFIQLLPSGFMDKNIVLLIVPFLSVSKVKERPSLTIWKSTGLKTIPSSFPAGYNTVIILITQTP